MPGFSSFPTRRSLLTTLAGAGIVQLAQPVLHAAGRATRTLVCLYHSDGNDSNNMVVPLDAGCYAAYLRSRGSLAIGEASLLTARTTSENTIGFHPSMPEMRDFFAMKRLAVVANVGSASARPAGSLLDPDLQYLPGAIARPHWAAAFGGVARTTSSARVDTSFPDTAAGRQLQKVATTLAQSPHEAHFFFVPVTSFGIGANQLETHAAALRDLSQAMASFFDATVELGISQTVTTYTDGAFNRTMAPSTAGRATPAWGGHQLVMGGAVLGGETYGRFPDFTLGGPDDAAKSGVWIPGITKGHYHGTLARWAGIRDAEFPTNEADLKFV
jgi:uncharacterized protein (DUF1501 family)